MAQHNLLAYTDFNNIFEIYTYDRGLQLVSVDSQWGKLIALYSRRQDINQKGIKYNKRNYQAL